MSILYNVRLLHRETGNQPEIYRYLNEILIGRSILKLNHRKWKHELFIARPITWITIVIIFRCNVCEK